MKEHRDSNAQLGHDVSVAFRSAFGRKPTVVACAPGRINLIGDHTDYNGGFVLPMAIDRATAVAAAPSMHASSQFVSTELGREASCALDCEAPGGFRRFVMSVAYELKSLGWTLPEIDLAIHSSVPIGAGLASSAALVVAVATMFEALTGQTLTPIEKAKLCQRAEARAGTPCGIMDMFVATHAVADCALLLDCRSLHAEHVSLPPAEELAWLVADTGVRHELADGAYGERRATCERAAQKLGKRSLRDVTLDELATHSHRLTPTEMQRVRHVLSENERVQQAAAALRTRDMHTFGQCMFASHDSLAHDFEVSCPELDAIVASARQCAESGSLGARMTGAGFGGSAIVLCESASAKAVATALALDFQLAFGRSITPFQAMPAGPTGCQLGRHPG